MTITMTNDNIIIITSTINDNSNNNNSDNNNEKFFRMDLFVIHTIYQLVWH